MYRLLNLPRTLTLRGNHQVVCDLLRPERTEELRQLFEESGMSGDGTGVDENLADIILQKPVDEANGKTALEFTDAVTGAFLGGAFIYPSWMCRSTRPVIAAGYIIASPALQNKRLGTTLLENYYKAAHEIGYSGHVGRCAVGSTSMFMCLSIGQIPVGMIPMSVLTKEGRRLSDLVIHEDYQLANPQTYGALLQKLSLERDILPEAPATDVVPGWVLDDVTFPTVKVKLKANRLVEVSAASPTDVLHVERLIRQAAAAGRGFALDEFRDGFFNRRFLRQSHMITAKAPNGDVIAGALFGRTTLCRSVSTPVLSVYMVVHPDYTRTGLGSALLSCVEEYARGNQIAGLFVDTFLCDTVAMEFLMARGFTRVCTFPKCAYVQHHGFTDCFLWYKQLLVKKDILDMRRKLRS